LPVSGNSDEVKLDLRGGIDGFQDSEVLAGNRSREKIRATYRTAFPDFGSGCNLHVQPGERLLVGRLKRRFIVDFALMAAGKECSSGPLHHMHFVGLAIVCRDQAGGAFRRAVAEMHKADVFQELRGKDGPFP
jgi:hypothetical protein